MGIHLMYEEIPIVGSRGKCSEQDRGVTRPDDFLCDRDMLDGQGVRLVAIVGTGDVSGIVPCTSEKIPHETGLVFLEPG